MIFNQVSVVLPSQGLGVATLGSTKVRETDTRQPPLSTSACNGETSLA